MTIPMIDLGCSSERSAGAVGPLCECSGRAFRVEICDDQNCEHCGIGVEARDNCVRSEELIGKADLKALFARADAQDRVFYRRRAERAASAKRPQAPLAASSDAGAAA